MSVSYSIVIYDYSARITIDGLNTVYPNKTFLIYLDGSYKQTISQEVYSGTWMYTYPGLSPGTEYYFKIECMYDLGTGIDALDGTVEDYFTTTGGSGGGDIEYDPYFTYSYSGDSLTITVHNISPYYYLSFWIIDRTNGGSVYDGEVDGRTRTNPFPLSGLLPSTTYRIRVDYSETIDGSLTSIPYVNGNTYVDFETDDSGGGDTPASGNGKVHLYIYGTGWVGATPYIYTYGTSGYLEWVKAVPYIYTYGTSGYLEWCPTI